MRDELNRVEPKKVFTIGYEGTSIEAFLECVKSAGVETLVDVRELPLSRKKGFSKNRLREAAAEKGIGYIHIKSLGDPKPGRDAAKSGNHALFEKLFNEHMATEVAVEGLAELEQIVGSTAACLVCFERNHMGCHRHIVVNELAKRESISVTHLEV